MEAITRDEKLMDGQDVKPITRKEKILAGEDLETITREEYFLKKYRGGSGDITVESLSVTENGTYSETGKAYSPVNVNVISNDNIKGDFILSGTSVTSYFIDAIIPNNTTEIGASLFYNVSGLKSINIPDTITRIGQQAFQSCSNLESSIVIPSGVTSIESATFSGCKKIPSVKFPNNLTLIKNNAFYGCESLTTIDIPSSIVEIGNNAFKNCSNLASITCRATTPPTIQTTTFSGVPASCSIYVPAESVETYKTANYWSARASYIQAIPS
jgi:hypothetical protein